MDGFLGNLPAQATWIVVRVGNEIISQFRAMLTRCSKEVSKWEAGNLGVFDGDKGIHGLYIPAMYERTTQGIRASKEICKEFE